MLKSAARTLPLFFLLSALSAFAEDTTTGTCRERIQNYDGSVTLIQPLVRFGDASLAPISFFSTFTPSGASEVCRFFGLGDYRESAPEKFEAKESVQFGTYMGKVPFHEKNIPMAWILCGPKSPQAEFNRFDRVEFGTLGALAEAPGNGESAFFQHPFVRGSGGQLLHISSESSADDVCKSLNYGHAESVEHEKIREGWAAKIGPKGTLTGYEAHATSVIRQLKCRL